MAEFDIAHSFTAHWEGGLTNHPADPGLITKYEFRSAGCEAWGMTWVILTVTAILTRTISAH